MAEPIQIPHRWQDLSFFVIAPTLLAPLSGFDHAGTWYQSLAFSWLYNFVPTVCMGGMIYTAYLTVVPAATSRTSSRVLRILIQAVVFAVGIVVGGEIAIRIHALWTPFTVDEQRESMIRVGTIASLLTIATLYILGRYRESRLKQEQERRAAVAAQLQALQSRTNPHFLFNSLNSVASLIQDDPIRAEEMLTRLSALFRYALDGSRREVVSLAEELTAVKTYLDVEQVRFGTERLRFAIDVDDSLFSLQLPPQTLQPIVENAVKHGIAQVQTGGHVELRAERANGQLHVIVENTSDGEDSNHEGSGTSLDDLTERLRLLYEGQATIERGLVDDGLYRVTVSLPVSE